MKKTGRKHIYFMKSSFSEWFGNKNKAFWEAVINFGKHNGKDLSQIDAGYLNWMLTAENPSPGMKKLIPDVKAELARRKTGQPTPAVSTPASPVAATQATKKWTLGKIVSLPVPNPAALKIGDAVAAHQVNPTMWIWQSLETNKTGALKDDVVRSVISSPQLPDGTYFQSTDLGEMKAKAVEMGLIEKEASPKTKSHILGDDKMHPELRSIDDKFAKMAEEEGSTMMISALSGSGKTTALKHLAWKYGKPGEKWLYLVFNTKNKTEAKEVFPPWVEVETTNGFLGRVLENPMNFGKMKQTERIVKLENPNTGRLEKAKIIADGPEFDSFMTSKGIPDPSQYRGDDKKLANILRAIRYEFKEEVTKFLGLAKSFAIDPRDKDLNKKIDDLMEKYDVNNLDNIKERVSKFDPEYIQKIADETKFNLMSKNIKEDLKEGVVWLLEQTMPHGTNTEHDVDGKKVKLKSYRDFNDDLWYAATHADQIHWPKYKFVLADEVQDFNEAQKIALKKLHDAGARIVAVGDKYQSIYKFRGSDSEAFDNLGDMLKEVSPNKDIHRSLSKNFRSKKAIIDFSNANTVVNGLQQGIPTKNGEEGKATKDKVNYEEAFDTLKKEKKENGKIMQTAFIARTNEPLIQAAIKLMKEGIPFIIIGKDMAKELIRHVDKIVSGHKLSDFSDVRKLGDALYQFKESEKDEHHGKAAKTAYLKELEETTEALLAAIYQFEEVNNNKVTITGFKIWLKNRFSGIDADSATGKAEYEKMLKELNPVVLTTAHRSKGMEWDRVYILRDDLFPHPRVKKEDELAQEEHMRYISYTRPREELHIISLDGQPGYEKKK